MQRRSLFFEAFLLWRKNIVFKNLQSHTVLNSLAIWLSSKKNSWLHHCKMFFFLYHKDKLFWQLLFHCSSSWLLLIQIMGSSGTSNAIMLSDDTHSPCHKMMIIWSTIGSMPSHYNTMHLSLLSKLFWSGGSCIGTSGGILALASTRDFL